MTATTLVSETPVWTAINSVPTQYPWLDQDETCEVAVIGAGITGALCALRLAQAGVNTVLLAANAVGYGSTGVSPGLMDYDGAGTLTHLSKQVGMDKAVRAFELCSHALDEMQSLVESLPEDVGFARKDSLLYTDNPQIANILRQEYALRLHTGFPVELVEQPSAREQYSFPLEAGILTKGMSAQVDPYRLCHALVNAAQESGARVYENTCVESITTEEESVQCLHTCTRHCVRAKKVIMASGHDCAQFTGGLLPVRKAYAIATKPVDEFAGWPNQINIREESAQSIYLRTTPDGRLLVGDIPAASRLGGLVILPKTADRRYADLECRLKDMFPGIRGIEVEYRFAGSMAGTTDGLPIIGGMAQHEEWYFALCPGVGGMLWAEVASRLLTALYKGETCEELALFAPSRK
ncbi:NAD(P)/FAD-dependent oxidoreductase [Solibaculum mannosilyticum]|uniref:NAD(P)/FAD-dependent oxidoreductase n=1 Tax=Solibaculum mannosilyticum TaxID=2780922 RepID=UPI0007A908B8|nr:Gamma-glutamylputrescine oxidoreductase [Eubacteriaceae bacterium CHKCI005]